MGRDAPFPPTRVSKHTKDMPSARLSARCQLRASVMLIVWRTRQEQAFRMRGRIAFRMAIRSKYLPIWQTVPPAHLPSGIVDNTTSEQTTDNASGIVGNTTVVSPAIPLEPA